MMCSIDVECIEEAVMAVARSPNGSSWSMSSLTGRTRACPGRCPKVSGEGIDVSHVVRGSSRSRTTTVQQDDWVVPEPTSVTSKVRPTGMSLVVGWEVTDIRDLFRF